LLGRSHRAKEGKARLKLAIDKTKALLGLPPDYVCAIVPASDTGAFEMAMWGMLGARGIDALTWESFGEGWVSDITKQLKLTDVRILRAEYGKLPNLGEVDFSRDVLFTWNGTTSGVRVPNGNWIASDRTGLTFADATSAIFAQPDRLLQDRRGHLLLAKGAGRGGRARYADPVAACPRTSRKLCAALAIAQGVSPHQGGKLISGAFEGETLNTPSMLCVEDYLDALGWAKSIGGLPALMARADANAAVLIDWPSAPVGLKI
jgi:phosphoserine aminotransferase